MRPGPSALWIELGSCARTISIMHRTLQILLVFFVLNFVGQSSALENTPQTKPQIAKASSIASFKNGTRAPLEALLKSKFMELDGSEALNFRIQLFDYYRVNPVLFMKAFLSVTTLKAKALADLWVIEAEPIPLNDLAALTKKHLHHKEVGAAFTELEKAIQERIRILTNERPKEWKE